MRQIKRNLFHSIVQGVLLTNYDINMCRAAKYVVNSGGTYQAIVYIIFLEIGFVDCVYESKDTSSLPIAIAFVVLLNLFRKKLSSFFLTSTQHSVKVIIASQTFITSSCSVYTTWKVYIRPAVYLGVYHLSVLPYTCTN